MYFRALMMSCFFIFGIAMLHLRYIDINVHMLENMYKKRIRGYAKLGYAPKEIKEDDFRTIYTNNHENDLFRDITAAKKSVIATGSYISSKHLNLLIKADCKRCIFQNCD